MCSQLDHSFGSPPLQAVLQPDSEFWSTSTSDVAYSKRKQLVQAFLLQERSKEEMKMLKTDMCSLVQYWTKRIEVLSQANSSSCSGDNFSRGVKYLLQKLKWESELILSKAVLAFHGIIELPTNASAVGVALAEGTSDADTDSDASSEDGDDDEDIF